MINVIINATAIKNTGGLTLLRGLYSYITEKQDDNYLFHLVTVVDEFNTTPNIIVYKVNEQTWFARVLWDYKGLADFCDKRSIFPDLVLSLQNTSSRIYDTGGDLLTQIVYYHQTIPLIKYNYSIFDKKERLLFLYSVFYPFFVTRYNKNTYYIVQLKIVKELFLKKFKRIKEDRVFVIKPDIYMLPELGFHSKSQNKFVYLFPATMMSYKNHKILLEALDIAIKQNPALVDTIEIVFTIDKLPEGLKNISIENARIIKCVGNLQYKQMVELYNRCDCLLFPSKVESFGLPLIEAASLGVPIVAADLPYAREVLNIYRNVEYIDPNSAEKWAFVLLNYRKYSKGDKIDRDISNSWGRMFELLDRISSDKTRQLRRG